MTDNIIRRAAIEAMLEPTPEMVAYGAEEVVNEYDDGKDQRHREVARFTFVAMINAALENRK